MKLVATFITLILFSLSARAAKDSEKELYYLIYAYPLSLDFRFDKNDQQDYRRLDLRLFGIGVEWTKQIELVFEHSLFDVDSASGSLGIHREQKENNIWARVPVYRWSLVEAYVGGALGYYDETIETKIAGATAVSTSTSNWMAGLDAGLRFLLHENLLLSIEGRSSFGKDFDPQPQFGGVMRLGLRF